MENETSKLKYYANNSSHYQAIFAKGLPTVAPVETTTTQLGEGGLTMPRVNRIVRRKRRKTSNHNLVGGRKKTRGKKKRGKSRVKKPRRSRRKAVRRKRFSRTSIFD